MHSNTTQQRKNKPKNTTREDPSSIQTTTSLVGSTSTTYKKNDDAQEVPLSLNEHNASNNNTSKSSPKSAHSKEKKPGRSKAPLVATVRRNMFGTSPFDKYWLNLDCCGLFCAIFTYMLHLYGCYVVCTILIPPWYTYTVNLTNFDEEEGVSETVHYHLSWLGRFHTLTFVSIALLACISHFQAMTTDPGAVPPDAKPLPSATDSMINSPRSSQINLQNSESNNDIDLESQTPLSQRSTSEVTENKLGNIEKVGLAATAVAAAPIVAGAKAVTTMASALHSDTKNNNGEINVIQPPSDSTNLNNKSTGTTTTPTARARRLCRRCNSFKPKRAHHCSICKRCIIKMDHHCPWVNNCVGIGNHKFFLLFILYTCLSCVYALGLLGVRLFQCSLMGPREKCLSDPAHLIHLVGLITESVMFGLFTCCMICDQWTVVTTNVTNIDRLKESRMRHDSGVDMIYNSPYLQKLADDVHKNEFMSLAPKKSDSAINEVFGGKSRGFQLRWISPFHRVEYPDTLRDEIMGFCTPCYDKKETDEEAVAKKSISTIHEV